MQMARADAVKAKKELNTMMMRDGCGTMMMRDGCGHHGELAFSHLWPLRRPNRTGFVRDRWYSGGIRIDPAVLLIARSLDFLEVCQFRAICLIHRPVGQTSITRESAEC